MKFLLDMNIPASFGTALVSIGHEYRHIQDINLFKADDEHIVLEAQKNDEVIITHDLDFGKILAFSNKIKPSVIIYRTGNINVKSMIALFNQYYPKIQVHMQSGAVIIIEDHSIRIRTLPVNRTY